MSMFVYLDGVNVATARIRLRAQGDQGVSLAASADGSQSQGGIVFDDSDGTLTVTGWLPVNVDEPDCSARRLFTGYIGDRTYRRGHYRLGAGREIDTTILDANILLRMRRINGSDSLRPQETDTQRLAWLLGAGYIPRVSDLGLVTGAGRTFEATQYKGQLPSDVLDDLVGPRGQIYFVYYDQTLQRLGLFYDAPTATTFTSTLTISNVLSDVDDVTCFSPYEDASSLVDPSEVYSNIRYVYKGGAVYRTNAAGAAFFTGDPGHRDTLVENDRVGKLSTATTFADRILLRDSVEAQSIDLTVRLPAAKVGLIQAGHRLAVRLSHVPGFTTSTYTRVETLSLVQTDSSPDYYDLTLHLSTHGLPGGGGTGSGSTDPFPVQPPTSAPPSVPDYNDNKQGVNNGHLTVAPVVGDKLVLFVASRTATGVLSTPTGWTKETDVQTTDSAFAPLTRYAALFSKVSVGTEGVGPYTEAAGELFEIMNFGQGITLGGVIAVNDAVTTALNCGSVTAPSPALVFGFAIESTADAATFSTAPGAGVTEIADFVNNSGNHPYLWGGYKTLTVAGTTSVTGTITCSVPGREDWGACSFYVVSSATANPPAGGQEVPWTVVTMSTVGGVSTGTTAFPYASSSLRVKVDGLLISSASYVETDAATGAFALTWIVDSDEVVTVMYQGI